MADALVSMLLEKLATTTYEYVEDELTLILNVKKEVEEFTGNLKAIESMLEDAEQRQMKEANVQNWLDNLKEISYQMVDVLDEWNTDVLRQEVEKQLRDNKQLFHLQLDFGEVRDKAGESSGRNMDVLRPHDDLESLEIYGYFGSTWPNWLMSLKKLRFLTLEDNCVCEILPPLGKLPFLEGLHLGAMSGVRKIGGEFLGVEDDQTSSFKSSLSILFPKLKRLHFYNMLSWKDWGGVKGWNKGDSGITIMPCLSSLDITMCSELETLPDFLCKMPLKNLSIFYCPTLAKRCKESSGEEWPKISHIPNVKICANDV